MRHKSAANISNAFLELGTSILEFRNILLIKIICANRRIHMISVNILLFFKYRKTP